MNNNNKNSTNKKNSKKNKTNYKLLIIVSAIYALLFIINADTTKKSLSYSLHLFISIIPVLFIVLIIMFLFNLINEEKFKKMVERTPRFMQYLIMTVLGTLSHGPIYAWYPLMKDMHNKGVSYGSISSFLYSRGIKLTFIPALIVYFGLKYTIILTVYLFLFSYILGIIMDLFNFELNKN